MTVTIPRDALDGSAVADVLVIGGGITGAAIAYEAASRGLSVTLVERGDFGGATSAATGRLIHGGLRYLKKLEIGLVRESLRERRTLSAIAPGLVQPIGMVLPDAGAVEHLGLTVYDALSWDRNRVVDADHRIPAHRTLSAAELSERGLGRLDSGVLFHDAMMLSPERLTLAFVRSAVAHGARVATYARAVGLLSTGRRVEGAVVADALTGKQHQLRARMTVNAAGPWSHDLLGGDPATAAAAGPAPAVRSEGIYLVTRPLTDTMVLTVKGRGHFSLAPWRGRTLIGPTETPYTGAVEDWRLTRRAIEDLVADVNAHGRLPQPLEMSDVLAAYGGLRPLTESGRGDTYQASRASELRDHERDGITGLISANGGKYTTSRAFAQQVVGRIVHRLGVGAGPSVSARRPLDACGIGMVGEDAHELCQVGAAISLTPEEASLLVRLYGTEATTVVRMAVEDPRLAVRVTDDGELLAGAAYAARHESVAHLTDIVLRRTAVGLRGDPGAEILEACADVAAAELGWDDARRARELTDARVAVALPTS